MELKLMTLNVWRYYEWESRKKNTLNFLKEQDADIVFLQEAALDERQKDKWANQVEEINEELNYSSLDFKKLTQMKKWHGKPIDWEMYYGFGILSKFKIKNSQIVFLHPVEKNKKFGFMHSVIETDEGGIDLINVHLENTDKGSREQLKKVLEWSKEKGIQPIIGGDFNMKITKDLLEIAQENYEVSYFIKNYVSFMPTNFSNNKEPITIDYIISHKEKFKMINVECIENNVSDHNPIIAKIKTK